MVEREGPGADVGGIKMTVKKLKMGLGNSIAALKGA